MTLAKAALVVTADDGTVLELARALTLGMLLAAPFAYAQSAQHSPPVTMDRLDPLSSGNAEAKDRVPIHTLIPDYPHKAWLERIEGDVEVCFNVTRGGRPYNIRVRKSDNRVFEKPARRAVKLSSFEAVPDDQKLPQIKTCRTFQFRLEPVESAEEPGSP